MRYYPVGLDIRNRDCLVVGGGSVAARKAGTLLECRAVVTVISPEFCEDLTVLEAENGVTLIRRPYASGDVEGRFLVIGATNDETLNRKISEDARRARREPSAIYFLQCSYWAGATRNCSIFPSGIW